MHLKVVEQIEPQLQQIALSGAEGEGGDKDARIFVCNSK